jgi:hypothetical protein
MPVKIREQGEYELFETNHGHQILVLNGNQWFAVVRGEKGDILVRTDADHIKRRTIQQGKFYLVDFIEDPKFKDMPHLFLQRDGKYAEWILPDELPTESDPQKRVVLTDDTLDKAELEHYLRHPAPPGPGEERLRAKRRKE